ncbi:hypothetical protein GE300_10905 [Rhodobacteraceae bacterium 2CG4]|uniref:Uncharacterized protein n=1 Tax=Halovulum marinum TaxID=2662447 RepID=A0A6L5Z1D1_9RHOB|nr:hypothetical protein [Halovulum marinum]MSU90119.1 hypothetical protein [Halovulum marinum]
MNRTRIQPPPNDWGRDRLTDFFDAYRSSQYATFASKRSEANDLIAIDGMFCKLLDGAINPRPLLPADFLFRAHAAFRAAAGAVMAGQVYETQALLRLCLEQGAYAHYIGDNQTRWEIWINRHEGGGSMKAARSAFTHKKVSGHIANANAKLGSSHTALCDRTIDYGAHPNERGASMNSMTRDNDDGGKHFEFIYLHGDGLMLEFGLKTAAQVGLWVLQIAAEIYPARMQELKLQHKIRDMAKRY